MNQRTDVWTYLIITAVAVVVWYWAAGETRVERDFGAVEVEFRAGDTWIVEPPSALITISAEGSERAIRNARQIERLTIDLTPQAGQQAVDLARQIRSHPDVEETGISVVSTVPAAIELTLDAIEGVPARVRPVLPGVQTVGEVVVDPPEVSVAMPSQLRSLLPEDLTVEAFLDRQELDRLERGIPQTIENVALRLPERVAPGRRLEIDPPRVTLTFTIRSQIRELLLDAPVRVQMAGPPEDSEYLVEFDQKQLREVTVSAPVEVIERIESGQAVVVALVHLKSTEKEARIERKPVTCFLALSDDAPPVQVQARVGPDGATRPEIGITITDRE
jgi:hypothetical protein